MSHAEIWDDSALVDSWNEAVAEYKQYHSIHARGENVEDVLRHFNGNDEHGTTNGTTRDGLAERVETNGMGEPHADQNLAEDAIRDSAAPSLAKDELPGADQASHMKPSKGISRGPPAPPQHLIGSVQDEGLKNLLMSWYYAGYYTGLYEGKNQAQQM